MSVWTIAVFFFALGLAAGATGMALAICPLPSRYRPLSGADEALRQQMLWAMSQPRSGVPGWFTEAKPTP